MKAWSGWLVGEPVDNGFGFVYLEHPQAVLHGVGHPVRAESWTTMCGLPMSPDTPQRLDIVTNCPGCGAELVRTGNALGLPWSVLDDCARSYYLHASDGRPSRVDPVRPTAPPILTRRTP